jgi:CDP-4-dehydro-6-deoxyglucose reductase
MALPPTFDARLASARALTPTVRELVFERADGQAMTFEPGQWVSSHFAVADRSKPRAEGSAEAPLLKRSYSIASSPDGSPRFEIAVTHVQGGPASTLLHALEPGAVLRFTGPQGFFTRNAAQGSTPALFVSTGTGVTPMRSMLRAAASANALEVPIVLVLGVRREEDLLYADEFRDLARRHAAFRFEPTLSRPHDSWSGRRGYVQSHVPALWDELTASARGGAPAPHVYVCGLERMVGSVRDLLRKEMQLPRQQVHSERYD